MKNRLSGLFDDFGLKKSKGRTERILSLDTSELTALSQELSRLMEMSSAKLQNQALTTGMNLMIPYSSEGIFKRIPEYLYLFDKVFLFDPLVDYSILLSPSESSEERSEFSLLEKTIASLENVPEWAHNFSYEKYKSLHDIAVSGQKLEQIERSVLATRMNSAINYYIQYEDLIKEGVLVPFILENDYYDQIQDGTRYNITFTDQLFARFAKPEQFVEWKEGSSPASIRNNILAHWDHLFDLHTEFMRFVINSFDFKVLSTLGSLPNVHLGGKENLALLDNFVEIVASSLFKDIRDYQGIQWPTIEDEISFQLLSGIPPQELLEIREKEKAAFEKYKYYAQETLQTIHSSATKENYRSLIKSLHTKQNKQMAEISLISENIQKKYLRKIAYQVSTVTVAAGAAILSASMANQDPLALLGVGIGSSGFTAGVAKLAETWLSYRDEIDQLKEKDVYLLWRLHQDS